MLTRTSINGLLLAALAFSGPVQAGTEKYGVSLGAFITDWETTARLDSESLGRGTEVNLETDLAMESRGTSARLDGFYRFNPRHRIDFSVFNMSRNGEASIDRPIQFGDSVYNVDTAIKSEFDLRVYKLDYTWSFLTRDWGNLGLTAGAYVAGIKVSASPASGVKNESRTLTAPLPVLGLRGEFQLAPRWVLHGTAQLFKLTVDNIEGSLVDLLASLEYGVSEQFSVGLGLNHVAINVDSSNSNYTGDIELDYNGALVYGRYVFGSLR